MVGIPCCRNSARPYQLIAGAEFVTLLQFAAYKGNKELVEYLLITRADPNIKGECQCFKTFHDTNPGPGGRYETALQAASASGNIHVVSLLVRNGADVTVQGECLHVQNNHALTPSRRGIRDGDQGCFTGGASKNCFPSM